MRHKMRWAVLTREKTGVLNNDAGVEVGEECVLGVYAMQDIPGDGQQTANTKCCGNHIVSGPSAEHLAACRNTIVESYKCRISSAKSYLGHPKRWPESQTPIELSCEEYERGCDVHSSCSSAHSDPTKDEYQLLTEEPVVGNQ